MRLRKLLTTKQANMPTQLLRWFLRLLSLPYAAIIIARNTAYQIGLKRTVHSKLPVISVGNLSVGGTGKTPTVAWIANWLRERHLRVAILSRGYRQLDSGQNDEALELELQLPDVPHLQNVDRVASASLAEEELEMQVLLLDDAFQHRRLARDFDIVLIDASESAAAWWLLPGGLLREPFGSLRRAHFVLLTRCDQAAETQLRRLEAKIRRSNPRIQIARTCHQPARLEVFRQAPQPIEVLRNQPVLAFCGIGHPDSFFQSLERLGAEVLDRRVWPDHHAYTANDVQQIAQWTSRFPTAKWLICTRKDWVKLLTPQIGSLPLAALLIELNFIDGQDLFEVKLSQVCSLPSPL